MEGNAFNLTTLEADLCEFEARLFYIVSSRPATVSETLSKKKKKKQTNMQAPLNNNNSRKNKD